MFCSFADSYFFSVQQNRLSTFPPVNGGSALSSLLLDDNHIATLPEGALQGTPLQHLQIARNRYYMLGFKKVYMCKKMHLHSHLHSVHITSTC